MWMSCSEVVSRNRSKKFSGSLLLLLLEEEEEVAAGITGSLFASTGFFLMGVWDGPLADEELLLLPAVFEEVKA